ncbi:metallophosphoesterase [Selenomonas sp. TAMA-11512]|uniref:metallophosphoesterase family protein n=1 Tax=Selenomonas sp. TAMA-11512 TaxID=3095337 RepID=UPI00308D949C|nr:metallophosphoesterase [Selenomonas sp. TAMA-11512]
MKIGIMSDSHNNRYAVEWAVARAGDVDLWLHAGDCVPDATYLGLLSSVTVENVAGNTDWPDGKTPDDLVVEAEGHRIFLTHGHIYGVRSTLEMLVDAAEREGADIAVYGHTHVVLQELIQGSGGEVLVINPGSISQPRDGKPPAFMIMTLEAGCAPEIEIVHYMEK